MLYKKLNVYSKIGGEIIMKTKYLHYLLGVFISAILVSLIKASELLAMKGSEFVLFYVSTSALGVLSCFLLNLVSNLRKVTSNLKKAEKLCKERIEEIENISNNMKIDNDTHLIKLFKDTPFGVFKIDTKHTGVLGSLIYNGLTQGFAKIQRTNDSGYLKTIQEALVVTNEFRGVNRKPINWFLRIDAGIRFLKKLRDKEMDIKKRIFIISDTEVEEMENDLQNEVTMSQFWELTGDKVETYWVTETTLKNEYDIREDIEDFAIYDDLIIKYDQKKQLDYKIVDENDLEYKIFENYLEDEIATKAECGIFTQIVRIDENEN